MQLEDIPFKIQVEVLREIVDGKIKIIKDEEISLFTFLNQILYLEFPFMLVLLRETPYSLMVEGVEIMSAVPRSTKK